MHRREGGRIPQTDETDFGNIKTGLGEGGGFPEVRGGSLGALVGDETDVILDPRQEQMEGVWVGQMWS